MKSLSLYLLLGLISQSAVADKVTLDPFQWGLAEGRACVDCHAKASAGLTAQWKNSAHARARVNCLDCHQASAEDEDALEHEGSIIATIVSPQDCGRCHETEFKQQQGSVHSQAVAMIKDHMDDGTCVKCHGSVVKVKGDGTLDAATWPNSGIGRVNPDGSLGSCAACHSRHQFSKEQARRPSACAYCHSGLDSPDKEVYATSKHGMMFEAHEEDIAPTCVTCHMGAVGKMAATHDVGMRDAWNLNAPVSTQQYLIIFEDGSKRELSASEPAPQRGQSINKLDGSMGKVKAVAPPERRRGAMLKTCLECHSKNFANNAMMQFDNIVTDYNEKYGKPAQAIMQSLYAENLLSATPLDEPLEITYWSLWHNSATRARHGAAMFSPANIRRGMSEVRELFYGKFMTELRTVAGVEKAEKLIKQHVKD